MSKAVVATWWSDPTHDANWALSCLVVLQHQLIDEQLILRM